MNNKLSILVVEDNEVDIVLIQEAFRNTSIKPVLTFVRNGKQALDYLLNQTKLNQNSLPDLIIMDINIPILNGLEVLKMIKSDVLLQHIPVIILSTSCSERDIKTSYQNYASYFLTKPIDLDDFYKMIEHTAFTWGNMVKLIKH